jgi:hypothetical protein
MAGVPVLAVEKFDEALPGVNHQNVALSALDRLKFTHFVLLMYLCRNLRISSDSTSPRSSALA